MENDGNVRRPRAGGLLHKAVCWAVFRGAAELLISVCSTAPQGMLSSHWELTEERYSSQIRPFNYVPQNNKTI